ncbi:Atf2 [Operophtera brumata]|uniref:Atf2 n=1 Tax=Operophtera brumata TaxID=104452 RepID=A0A0L7LBW2_OPEBR|nr:Atf2 [Operophtera brumata]
MVEPAKPFACTIQGCGMTFTNEDHLHVHTKKHDMVLQFGMEQKAVFDLQNVNPFDEGFKRAMESKSSSDESGAIKEFETTTISKLTNEVTTISRIVEKHEDIPKNDEPKKDSIRKDSVSYKNNVIKILSNVEVRNEKPITEHIVKKEPVKDYLLQVPPIMSQQSIDNVVESLTSDFTNEIKKEESRKDYEVILKLPSGQQIKLTSAEVDEKPKNTKDLLKKVLTNKVELKSLGTVVMPSVIPISSGSLIPVSLVNGVSIVNNTISLPKLPLKVFDKRPVKRKSDEMSPKNSHSQECKEKIEKESRKAASKRYREQPAEKTHGKVAAGENLIEAHDNGAYEEMSQL